MNDNINKLMKRIMKEYYCISVSVFYQRGEDTRIDCGYLNENGGIDYEPYLFDNKIDAINIIKLCKEKESPFLHGRNYFFINKVYTSL